MAVFGYIIRSNSGRESGRCSGRAALREGQMKDKAWWGPSALLSAALMGMIGFLWYEAVNEYVPHPGQLTNMAAVDAYLLRHPSGADRVLIPTGVFIQSLHFITASDVNIKGYIWQKYSDDVPKDITLGFTLPEQVLSSDTVITEAYRRSEGEGVVVGWYFDATLRQPFDYSRYPLDRHEVWLRMWHRDFDRNIVLTPDLGAYDSTREGDTFGVDFEIVPGGWHIEETLFEYKDGNYDTDFGISNYVGQNDFPELYFTVIVSRGFVDAFVINLVPLLIVAGLLFAVLMISTSDPERAAVSRRTARRRERGPVAPDQRRRYRTRAAPPLAGHREGIPRHRGGRGHR